jgi:hypothetical protein
VTYSRRRPGLSAPRSPYELPPGCGGAPGASVTNCSVVGALIPTATAAAVLPASAVPVTRVTPIPRVVKSLL